MSTYNVYVHLRFKGGAFNDVYSVSAGSREAAEAKARDRIFAENSLDDLVEAVITDCKECCYGGKEEV